MGHASESVVNQATISARAEALEKKEADDAAKGGKGDEGAQPDPKEAEAKAAADKAAADKKVADDKAEADRKAAEDAEAAKGAKKPAKKEPNDPEEMRKWSTRVSQENSKLRKEMSELKEAQEKTYKLLASLSKNPVDYKELAKNPEALQKFVEEERDAMTSEFQEQIDGLAAESKAKDTAMERMRREHDTENYPEWKRVYPEIVKLAMGPSGTGDPRIDFTKPAGEILDALYELALQANPATTPVVKTALTPAPEGKTFSEAEVKAMVSDMVSKEKEAIAKAAKEEAIREAQEALRSEAAGGTVASAGRGAGRVPTDQLAAFKKMSLSEQRDWLIAQQENK
jgi:hypothetical protein